MGYTTDFEGRIGISPPLNAAEYRYLIKFNDSRRMLRENGPYCVEDEEASDVINYNSPPEGQPGLWCQWKPAPNGDAIVWDEGEKFYEADRWMAYLIKHFLADEPLAKKDLPFLWGGHVLNGTIEAQGEEAEDRWSIIVEDNKVFVQKYKMTADGERVEVE